MGSVLLDSQIPPGHPQKLHIEETVLGAFRTLAGEWIVKIAPPLTEEPWWYLTIEGSGFRWVTTIDERHELNPWFVHGRIAEALREASGGRMAGMVKHPRTASAATDRRIRVVDDDEAICALVSRMLEGAGYVAETAHDGREGLAKVESFHPDLVILDLMMPEMDGWTFLQELEARRGDPAVLILSAYPDPERATRAGAAASLSKPFRYDDLLVACDRLLAP